MNITLPSNLTPTTGGSQQVSVNLSLPGLPGEESFTAKVLFVSGDTVHLKTEEGALIKAHLEGGVQLTEGSIVLLETVEKNADIILLRVAHSSPEAPAGGQALSESAMLNLAEQLQTPGLSAQQRIELIVRTLFGASQANPSGQTSALPAIDPEAQMGRMLTELLGLLAENGTAVSSKAAPSTTPTAAASTPAPVETGAPATGNSTMPPPLPSTATGAALRIFTSILYTMFGGPEQTPALPQQTNAPPLPGYTGQPEQAPTATGSPTPPTVSSSTAQPAPGGSPPGGITVPADGIGGTTMPAGEAAPTTTSDTPPTPAQTIATSPKQTLSGTPPVAIPDTTIPENPVMRQTAAPPLPREETTAQIKLLPTAAEVPPQKLDTLLETAQQIMAELRPTPQTPLTTATLQQFADRLFARVGETAPEAAELLKKAVNELDLRLSFLEEAIERSQLSHKNELLSQTQRVLNHAESLRQTERFYCLQIPIQFDQQRQTAELYIYRRERGGGKIDPENATILLALDTAHLGRVETAIQVKKREVTLKMETSRPDAVPFLKERGNTLYGLLAKAGYKLTSTAFLPLKEKTTVQNAEHILREYQQSFGHKVDFRI